MHLRASHDERWRSFYARREFDVIESEAQRLLHDPAREKDPFLLNWIARLRNQACRFEEALAIADEAHSTAVAGDDRLTAALATANIGLARMGLADWSGAIAELWSAEEMLRDLGESWLTGTVLINRATCEFRRGDFAMGLELLDEAEGLVPQTAADHAEAPMRAAFIANNRAAAISSMPGSTVAEGIERILSARHLSHPAGHAAADVDANLGALYSRLGQYGSALLAARSAAKSYAAENNHLGVKKARIQIATASAHLGQLENSVEIIDELIGTHGESDPEIGVMIAYLTAALDAKGRSEMLSRYGGLASSAGPDSGRRQEVVRRLSELRRTAGRPNGDAAAEARELLDELDALAVDEVDEVVAQFERAVHFAEVDPASSPGISADALRKVRAWFGPRGLLLDAVVDGFAAEYAGDAEGVLTVWLRFLWNSIEGSHDQQSEEFRSEFVDAKHVLLALDSAIAADRPEAVIEIIETIRVDSSGMGTDPRLLGLPSFDSLPNSPAVELDLRYLARPATVGVRGKSMIASAANVGEPSIDLDSLRSGMAGEDALWWSMAIVEDVLYWSLLDSRTSFSGARVLDRDFDDVLSAHLGLLPLVKSSDLEVMPGLRAGQLNAIAIARSAAGAMMRQPFLQDAAVASLPPSIQQAVRGYCAAAASASADLDQLYGRISSNIVPEQLRTLIRKHGDGRSKIIVTVPPELATVPLGLLPLEPRVPLIQCATLQYAPPPRLASRVISRAEAADPPRAHLLSVADTLGDLPSARPDGSSPAVRRLGSWSNAVDEDDVATIDRVEHELRTLSAVPGSAGLVSFRGHLAPGDHLNPGSAAIACAPRQEAARPDLLSARRMFRWEPCLPSHVYLGGCEGTGFGTGLEWASIAAAALACGAQAVVSHAWPIIDAPDMSRIDSEVVRVMQEEVDVAEALADAQADLYRAWRRGQDGATPPHYWAGLQTIGLSRPR